mmetsp:Transcript_22390/g.33360  ORF Transcript_22390/g.33360 Transcript_22390/m.33360 type:complete len:332 (+) Transcript_22390:288-1283(+)
MPGKISLDEEKKLDGHAGEGKTDKTIKKTFGFSKKGIIKSFASRSHVGYVPFNSGKVNQDRYTEHPSFMGKANKSLYGVFDGHGVYGHDVSQYLIDTLPKMIAKEKNLDKDFKTKITNIFVACNENLKKSGIDTACSGTTAVVCYIVGTRILTCNSGDSRAVIALRSPDGKLVAKPLSIDQKPELESEKKRILKEGGRVQACRDLDGNPVGPLRVWLRYQDIPGLAMTRSFGDSLAASVGVSCKPDILEHDIKEGKDQFFILASDGVWEFISNQEAVDIVAKCKSPEEAAEALVAESTKRWQEEEDVIDDITATVVYLKGSKYPLGPSKKK